MRVPLQCAALLYVAAVANGKRTVRDLADVAVEDNQRTPQQRRLKKGDERDDDYYYAFEKNNPKTSKGGGARLSPVSPSLSFSSRLPSFAGPSPLKKKIDSSEMLTTYGSKKSKMKGKSSMGGKGPSPSGGKGKGKGKGKGGGIGPCSSPIADAITEAVPEVITRNPVTCCDFSGPIAVYVTHALPSDITQSGFELFWDEIYAEIARTSSAEDVCFVMTGLNPAVGNTTVDEVLIETIKFVSEIPNVVAMMVTDPTQNVDLITEIRRISDNAVLPSIGVFNAGYNNIVIESIVSGKGRLPYVGFLSDKDYGTAAGEITLEFLNGVPARPLCYNARLGVLDNYGERCAAYYSEVTSDVIQLEYGAACSFNSTVSDVLTSLNSGGINAVWAPLECCAVVADAVAAAKAVGRKIVVGCQDGDPSGGRIDFVTKQPIALQGYSAASWANFPVVQSNQGNDGRGEQFFPSLQSLVNTAIFNMVIL